MTKTFRGGALVNTCEFVVDCLLEIRVAAGYRSVEDVENMVSLIKANVARLPAHAKFSIVADWRAVSLMSPDTAIRARQMLMSVNPRVNRSAILVSPDKAISNLQVVRLVREAENENRRHFTSPEALHGWLAEVLSEPESTRLRQFLEMG